MQQYHHAAINVMARAVADYFKGTVNADLMDWRATILIPVFKGLPPAKLHLTLRNHIKNARLEVSIGPDFGPKGDSFRNTAGLPFPSATFSMARNGQDICKGIASRIVNHADTVQALRAFEARKAEHENTAANVLKHRDAILAAFPHIKAYDTKPDRAVINGYGKGIGFAGHVGGDGHFSFNTIGSVPMEKALRIMAILSEPK